MKLDELKKQVNEIAGPEYEVLETNENINTHNKVKIKHNICGNILEVTPNHFLQREKVCRCKYCAGKVKKTTDDIKKLIDESSNNEYELATEIKGYEKAVILKHKVSGELISTTPKSFIKGYNRAKADTTIIEKKDNDFKTKIKNLVGDEYSVLSHYNGNREYIKLRHNICGKEYEIYPDSFIQGARCKCTKEKTKKTENVKKSRARYTLDDLKELRPDITIISTELNSLKDKIAYYCEFCKENHIVTARNLVRGFSCKKAGHEKTGDKIKGTKKENVKVKSDETVQSDIEKAIGTDYEMIPGTYKKSSEHFTIMHKTCGNEYQVLLHNIITHHTTCPYCMNKNYSKEQDDVMEYIKSIYSGSVEKGKKLKYNSKIREADILLEDKKLIIEFDGLYWHCDEKLNKEYHREKSNMFKKLGYDTIHIFEDDWTLRKEETERKLSDIINGTVMLNMDENDVEVDLRWNVYCKLYENAGYKLKTIYYPHPWRIPKGKSYCEPCTADEIETLKQNGDKVIWDCGYAIYSKDPLKLTNEQFINKLKEKRPDYFDNYEILDEYKGNKVKLTVKHKDCGQIFMMSPMHIMRGQNCSICNCNKKTNDWFIEASKHRTDEYEILSEYKTGKDKIKFKHIMCGNIFEMRPNDFLRGQNCPKCARKSAAKKKTKKQIAIEEMILTLGDGDYELVSNYVSSKIKVNIKHKTCGNVFGILTSNFKNGHRCPFCFGTPKRTDDEVAAEIEQDPDYEFIRGSYTNSQEHFKIKHKSCGYVFDITMINYRKGHRCPHCAFKSSSEAEKELLTFVKGFYPNAEKKRFTPDQTNRRKFVEADICIEERKLLIEFDGLYWHSDARVDKDYHKRKNEIFRKLGYDAIHIFEDDWKYKNSEVIVALTSILTNEKNFRKKYN